VTFSYTIVGSADVASGFLQTVLTVTETEPGCLTPCRTRTVTIPGFGFVHDFCFTANDYIIVVNPVDLDLVPFVAGVKTPGACLSFNKSRPSLLLLASRHDHDAVPRTAQLDRSTFVFHHAGAWEEDGHIQMDSIMMDGLYLGIAPEGGDFREAEFSKSAPYRLWRTTIPLLPTPPGVVIPATTRCLSPAICEFPTVAPSRFGLRPRFAYAALSRHPSVVQPLQAWAKFDLEMTPDALVASYEPGDSFFAGEPQFVVRPGGTAEDDGWLIGWLHDAKNGVAALAIVCARTMSQLALLRLDQHVPYGLHGTWSSAVLEPLLE